MTELAERPALHAMDLRGVTIVDRLREAATNHGEDPALSYQDGAGGADGGGDWQTLTWAEVREQVLEVAAGLAGLGVEPGDRIALMMPNVPEHVIADQGAVHAGGVPLTVYATFSPDQVAFVVTDAQVRVAVVQGADQLDRFADALATGQLRHVVVIDEAAVPAGDDRFLSWSRLRELGRAAGNEQIDQRLQALSPEDVVTVLYTSGTTGNPKGVRLTHANVLYEVEQLRLMHGFQGADVNISYLPYAHIAQRCLGIYIPIHLAGQLFMCPDPTQLVAVLRAARPTSFFGVPRIWEKFQSGLSALLSLEPDAERRHTVAQAMAVALEFIRAQEAGGTPGPELRQRFDAVDAAVLAPLRAALGLDRATWFSSGAAPIAPAVLDFFAGLGIALCEVYGMTETTGAVTANTLGAFRLGSVGRALDGCEVRIADDGEVLVRGPLTTPGYLDRPEQTAELVDGDGWLHTGDIGSLDSDGYLTIVDRKKELIITSGGENVSPAAVESQLKQHPLVGQAMAVGDRRKHLAALLVLDPEVLPGWLAAAGLPALTVEQAATHDDVLAAVGAAVTSANERLARVQQVKTWRLLTQEWTAESGELTPTLKLKRRVVLERYATEIEQLYS